MILKALFGDLWSEQLSVGFRLTKLSSIYVVLDCNIMILVTCIYNVISNMLVLFTHQTISIYQFNLTVVFHVDLSLIDPLV